MKRKVVLLATVGLVLAAAGVPKDWGEPPAFEWKSRGRVDTGSRLCFPTGLAVTAVVDRRQPVVSITSVVDVGWRHETAENRGAAHLLEHLWFWSDAGLGGAAVWSATTPWARSRTPRPART
ncbi:MAG: insulinase family protein [Proteobacteria bacterium]|nr:insulinase family protein [Pseudomonadota bacterium]MCP4921752.1 insulinase family protein [Pseudomonadota bacterium]